MKFIIVVILLIFNNSSFSQEFEVLKNKIRDIRLQSGDDNLKWIITKYDFDQTNLSIDEIDSIIKFQIAKKVEKIETPINLKKLKYFGYYDFKKLGLVKNNSLFKEYEKEYEDANGPKNIYQYENITILNTYNAFEDQLNVFSIIRSLLVLRIKYKKIHKILFIDTKKSILSNTTIVKDKSGILNTNKHIVFSIHENSNKLLSATTTNYGPKYKNPILNKWEAENVHLIFLNKSTLRNGGNSIGSTPIYIGMDKKDAQIKFLFDGLIQTIIHERLHDYISNYMTVNTFYNYIRNDNSLVNNNQSTYKYIEEPIVTNTTNHLFFKYGGLSQDVMRYYSDLFTKYQLNEMKKNTNWESLIKKLDDLNSKNVKSNYSNILKIYF